MKIDPGFTNGLPKIDQKTWQAAQSLETAFLSEMLKSSGFGQQSSLINGGIGEEQFSSFMREAQAKKIVQAGGIGLAETIYRSLLDKQNA